MQLIMDSWILKGVKHLVNEPTTVNITSPTQVKIKVTHLMLTDFDEVVYNGGFDMVYPKIPGRAAVGIVMETGENCYGLEKGTRVYFEPTRACGECLACKSGKPKECTAVLNAGREFDGFMRDFVVCEYNEVAPLPDSVSEFQALCIETIGIAENIYDKLNLSAGQRVAIIGADFSGNIIAQVLQYHKVIPIIIDNNAYNLENAKRCGIYYAFAGDDDLEGNMNSATSGNLCDAAVYCATSRLPLSLATRLVANGKTVVISCQSEINASLSARDVLNKNLQVLGVSQAYDYTDTVINMLVHNAVDVDHFAKDILTDYNPAALLAERSVATVKKSKMTILKMVL